MSDGSATRVASAHQYNSWVLSGATRVTAWANRAVRSGPTDSPAARSAAANRAASAARSARAAVGSAIKECRQSRRLHGRQVLVIFDHSGQCPLGRVGVQSGHTEDGESGRPAYRLGDAGRLVEVEPAQPADAAGDPRG